MTGCPPELRAAFDALTAGGSWTDFRAALRAHTFAHLEDWRPVIADSPLSDSEVARLRAENPDGYRVYCRDRIRAIAADLDNANRLADLEDLWSRALVAGDGATCDRVEAFLVGAWQVAASDSCRAWHARRVRHAARLCGTARASDYLGSHRLSNRCAWCDEAQRPSAASPVGVSRDTIHAPDPAAPSPQDLPQAGQGGSISTRRATRRFVPSRRFEDGPPRAPQPRGLTKPVRAVIRDLFGPETQSRAPERERRAVDKPASLGDAQGKTR